MNLALLAGAYFVPPVFGFEIRLVCFAFEIILAVFLPYEKFRLRRVLSLVLIVDLVLLGLGARSSYSSMIIILSGPAGVSAAGLAVWLWKSEIPRKQEGKRGFYSWVFSVFPLSLLRDLHLMIVANRKLTGLLPALIIQFLIVVFLLVLTSERSYKKLFFNKEEREHYEHCRRLEWILMNPEAAKKEWSF